MILLRCILSSVLFFLVLTVACNLVLVQSSEATVYTTLLNFLDGSTEVCTTNDEDFPFVWALEYPNTNYATINVNECKDDVIFKNSFEEQ